MGASSVDCPQSLHAALPDCIRSPHQNLVCVPARAAYSHSASVGRRYRLPVTAASQPTYCLASFQLTLLSGASSSPVAARAHALADAHAFHSRTVTGYLPSISGAMLT